MPEDSGLAITVLQRSRQRLANVTAAAWPVGFRFAVENTLAEVKAFGMVVSDVDQEKSTSLEFFRDTKGLGIYHFKPKNDQTPFSFFDIIFKETTITKVMIRHNGVLSGNIKDISEGITADLVVYDDLVYSEPVKLRWNKVLPPILINLYGIIISICSAAFTV